MPGSTKRRPVSMPKISLDQSYVQNAIRCKRYRDSRKDDQTFKEKEKMRKQKFRQSMTEEQKERRREKGRERMRRLREKRKEEGMRTNGVKDKQIVKTRKMILDQREKWREAKRKHRANLSAQKRRRIREKERKIYKEKCQEKEIVTNRMKGQQNEGDAGYRTEVAARVAVSRAKASLPQQAVKFTAVIQGLVSGASPRKRQQLSAEGLILTPTKKKRLLFFDKTITAVGEMYTAVKQSRKTKDVKQRRVLASHIATLKKYRLLRKSAKTIGIRWGTLIKWSKMDTDCERAVRKDAMKDDERQQIEDFYVRPNVSVTHSSKKYVLKRLNKQRQTMRRSLRSTFTLYKNEHPASTVSYSKFCKLRPQHVKTQNGNKFDSCLCERCINIEMKLKAINKEVQLGDKYEASRRTMCPYSKGALPKKECAKRECDECGVHQINQDLQNMSESEKSISWYEWKSEDVTNSKTKEIKSKKTLAHHSGTEKMLVEKFLAEMKAYTYHLFVATWQHQQYSLMKNNLREGHVLSVLDFAENYTTDMQDECQSAHWAKKQVTIHPVVNYYISPADSMSVKTHEQVFISDDLKHDYHFVHAVTLRSLENLNNNGINVRKMTQFTDGCSAQYKSKVPFMDISCASQDFPGLHFDRNYFGSGHGKGPADGCSGVIKSSVTRAVKGRTAIVRDAQDFFKFCNENLEKDSDVFKRTFHFITTDEIDRDRPERVSAITVQGTRKLHSVRPEKPGVIMVRELSCSCEACVYGNTLPQVSNCTNSAAGQWKRELTSKSAEPETAELQPQMETILVDPSEDPFICGDRSVSPLFEDAPLEDYVLDTEEAVSSSISVDEALDLLTDTWFESESPRPTVGQFVQVRIPCGKSFRNFIGLVEKLSAGTEDDVLIRFMEEVPKNGLSLYRWPSKDDRSTEPISNIIKILPEPELDDLSTNRVQFFKF